MTSIKKDEAPRLSAGECGNYAFGLSYFVVAEDLKASSGKHHRDGDMRLGETKGTVQYLGPTRSPGW